jgi:MYXO-CTERM domain-containing protein
MNVRTSSVLPACAFLLGLSLWSANGHAKALDKCGGIFLSASSSCEFRPVQDCMTTCTTTSVEQVCAQQTYTSCSDSCTTTDTKTCTQERSESCEKQCDTITTKSSHEVCVSECSDSCTSDAVSKGKFGGDEHKCGKNCSHDCYARCDTCSTTDQDTDCMTKCTSIVSNECTEEVTRDCVLDCQTTTFDDCQTTTVDTCTTSCKDKGGAIFCDGQFISAGNLRDCADQLAAEFSFNIDVTIHASVNGDGKVTTTNDDGSKSTKCSFSGAPTRSNGVLYGALAAIGVGVAATRRRRRR